MASSIEKWSVSDLSQAMVQAISQEANQRFLKRQGDVLKFNGFWRNGDKQNVCAWLDKATWHDAKTGEGGGCKEFAKVAFNQTLPEFMERFGPYLFRPILRPAVTPSKKIMSIRPVDEIWSKLLETSNLRVNPAEKWLEKTRGFSSPKTYIGSGFASLAQEDISLFDLQHQSFIKQRLELGPQLVVPIRDTCSSKVQNLFFRALLDVDKNDKSRVLTNAGGWNTQNSLRAFGFPHLINDFPKIIICEGMADYFAVECLLACNGNFLALGASNASALKNWAAWLSSIKYQGTITIMYQLDRDQSGRVSSNGLGQMKATEALKILLHNRISASLFKWSSFLRFIKAYEHKPSDIADICQIFGSDAVSDPFIKTLSEVN